MKKISFIGKIKLICLGLFLCLILLEVSLYAGGFIFLFLQEHRNKASLKKKDTYRIICFGESTTAIGGGYSYPSQLEEILNKKSPGIKFSVVNKGIIAANTGFIVSQLEENLAKYKPDMVITMMGVNDRRDTMANRGAAAKEARLVFKKLKIYKLAELLRLHILRKAGKIGIYKSEEEKLKRSMEANPENHSVYIELYRCYKKEGKFDEAENILERAIEINPKNDRAYIELDQCYRDQGKSDKAKRILERAIEVNPKNDRAYIELSWAYKGRGEYAKAEEMFKKGIEANPSNNLIYFGLGCCYERQKKYDKAEKILKKVIAMMPLNDDAYAILANCYMKLGKYKLAEKYFQKASKIRVKYYNHRTSYNYKKFKEIVSKKGIRIVCVQYPMRSIIPLKNMFESKEGIIFVNNESIFKKAVQEKGYEEYFIDIFGGNFGHCTPKGDKLLAENIANVILKEVFDK